MTEADGHGSRDPGDPLTTERFLAEHDLVATSGSTRLDVAPSVVITYRRLAPA
jgi:hypothetical protein